MFLRGFVAPALSAVMIGIVSLPVVASVRPAFNPGTFHRTGETAGVESYVVGAVGNDDSEGVREVSDSVDDLPIQYDYDEPESANVRRVVLGCGQGWTRLDTYGFNNDIRATSFARQYSLLGSAKYEQYYGTSFPKEDIKNFIVTFDIPFEGTDPVTASQIIAKTASGARYDITSDVAANNAIYFNSPDPEVANAGCTAYVNNPAIKVYVRKVNQKCTRHRDDEPKCTTSVIEGNVVVAPRPSSNILGTVCGAIQHAASVSDIKSKITHAISYNTSGISKPSGSFDIKSDSSCINGSYQAFLP